MTAHLWHEIWHEIVDDYSIKRSDGSHFQSLAAAGSSQNSVPGAFQERLFTVQHVFVIVDTKNHFASGFQVDGRAHGPDQASVSTFCPAGTGQNCSYLSSLRNISTFYVAIVSSTDHRRLVPFPDN